MFLKFVLRKVWLGERLHLLVIRYF